MRDASLLDQIHSKEHLPPCLCALIPVYNEEATITKVVETVLAQRPVQEVIILDDASRDSTWAVLQTLRDPHIRLLQRSRTQGKEAALREAVNQWEAFVHHPPHPQEDDFENGPVAGPASGQGFP